MPGTPPAPRNELVSLLQKLEDEVFFAVLDVALDVENELITGAQPVFVAIRRIAVRYTILCPINSVGAVDRYCELRWKALTFLKKYDLISSFTHREQGGHRWEGVVEVTVQDLVRYTELLVQLRIEENRRNTGQELEPEIADAPAGLTQHTTQFGPVVFISHSSKDADLALALVDLLKAAFHLTADQIRCSSVDGYRLPVGVNTESKLREEVNAAKVVVGLITPSALVSYYVMFELGARWGAGLFLAPLLAGVKASDLQGPIALLNALSADNETQLHQLIQDISPQLKLTSQPPASYHRYVCTVSNGAAAVKPAILSVPSESLPIDAKPHS